MRIVIYLFTGVVFNLNIVYAQTDSTVTEKKSGQTAILFQIGRGFELTSFEGATLSIKRQASETKAWRLGLNLNGEHSDDNVYTDLPDSLNYYIDTKRSSASASIFLTFQISKQVEERTFFYYGYGLNIVYSHHWTNPVEDVKQLYNSYSIGPVAYLGVEWFANKNISVSGEYGLIGYYTYRISEFTAVYNDISELVRIKGFSYGLYSPRAKLGLSIYM